MEQFEPILGIECSQCTATPVVGLRAPSGIIISTGLCGPHFFGDRTMVDPDEWNNKPESTA